MSKLRVVMVGMVVSAAFVVAASGASALTLGTTSFPAGATGGGCSTSTPMFFTEASTDSAYSYAAPSGGGLITSWSVNTADATPGTPITFLVLRPSGGYTVVASDPETLPATLPPSGVATFALPSPITVRGGDVIGLYAFNSDINCYFFGGSTPPAEAVVAGSAPSPAPGTTYSVSEGAGSYLANVSAELTQSQDASVSVGVPTTTTAGGSSVFGFTVANSGPSSAPITFVDTIPAGLSILGAAAGSGGCSVAAATVSCTITGLAPGASAPVLIAVSAPTAGSYTDTGSVSTPVADPNPANNAAGVTLTVPALPAAPLPTCKIVSLKKQTLAVAKLFLPALGCKVGKVTHKTSKTIKTNLIISTSPGTSASKPLNTKVNVVISSGKPKKKKAKAKKKH